MPIGASGSDHTRKKIAVSFEAAIRIQDVARKVPKSARDVVFSRTQPHFSYSRGFEVFGRDVSSILMG